MTETNYQISELHASNDTWDAFISDWRNQCNACDESFDGYAEITFPVLQSLIDEPIESARVLAIKTEGNHAAVCHANTALIKGYDEPVLRIRHLILSPEFDFGDKTIEEYADMLVAAIAGILLVSNEHPTLKAKHLKFHLRSPADRSFFAALGKGLDEDDEFESVQMAGSWLYLTKA